MRFLQSEPDVPLAEQSVSAQRRGVPWWGAVLIAFGFALLGIAIDSAASRMFSIADGVYARPIGFAVGCLLAALAVRNRALFTAAVQPPLIAVGLVVARVIGVQVKGLVTSAHVPELNSLLIKQVFAFSKDFPVILFTFLAVLTVVLVRYWRYRSARRAQQAERASKRAAAKSASATGAIRKSATAVRPADPATAVVRPESAAVRASRAAAQAHVTAREARPTRPPAPEQPFRAAPSVVPGNGLARRPSGATHPSRPPRSSGPAAVRPSQQAAPTQRQDRRRAAPPPLDDEGF